jgi:hypothetical protein
MHQRQFGQVIAAILVCVDDDFAHGSLPAVKRLNG